MTNLVLDHPPWSYFAMSKIVHQKPSGVHGDPGLNVVKIVEEARGKGKESATKWKADMA